jgi:hypothetical protein
LQIASTSIENRTVSSVTPSDRVQAVFIASVIAYFFFFFLHFYLLYNGMRYRNRTLQWIYLVETLALCGVSLYLVGSAVMTIIDLAIPVSVRISANLLIAKKKKKKK